ncbi:MAG: glucokinase [Frankiaceae bacterium]|nr:glucokinase [Frankiaceae bacterium]
MLAVDIGGTKISAALVAADGSLDRRREIATPADADAEELCAGVLGLLDDVCGPASPEAVGVGCGGPMQWPQGVVSPLNIPAWRAFPLADRLRAHFRDAPVAVHNDAVAMALGEYLYGAGRRTRSFLGVVVSTGVGGGLVLDGEVVSGPTGNAGHIGHVVVDVDGPTCGCGGRGCLEAIARGPAVVAWAREQGWKPTDPAAVIDGRSLVSSARSGDALAIAALTRAGRALGVALASVAATLDLDAVAVGGGLVNAGDLLLGPARAAFDRHARLDFTRRCHIVASELRGDAGLLGAAALARRAT